MQYNWNSRISREFTARRPEYFPDTNSSCLPDVKRPGPEADRFSLCSVNVLKPSIYPLHTRCNSPPRCSGGDCRTGILGGVGCCLATDVSGQHVSPVVSMVRQPKK